MSDYVQDIEQVAGEFENSGNNQNSSNQQDSNPPQEQGSGTNQNQSSGGGPSAMEDGFVNDAIDAVANKEGVPAGLDGTLNEVADQEVNKFL